MKFKKLRVPSKDQNDHHANSGATFSHHINKVKEVFKLLYLMFFTRTS